MKSGIAKTAGDNMEVKSHRFLFDYRRTLQSTTGKSPMEILNNRKMRSRLDLLHPSLQGKIYKKEKPMKEPNDRRAHERHFEPGDSMYIKNFEPGDSVYIKNFEPGDSVYIKNFCPGLKWLIGSIGYVKGPVSYVMEDGRECRRHIDNVRERHANTRSADTKTRSNQFDADTVL